MHILLYIVTPPTQPLQESLESKFVYCVLANKEAEEIFVEPDLATESEVDIEYLTLLE